MLPIVEYINEIDNKILDHIQQYHNFDEFSFNFSTAKSSIDDELPYSFNGINKYLDLKKQELQSKDLNKELLLNILLRLRIVHYLFILKRISSYSYKDERDILKDVLTVFNRLRSQKDCNKGECYNNKIFDCSEGQVYCFCKKELKYKKGEIISKLLEKEEKYQNIKDRVKEYYEKHYLGVDYFISYTKRFKLECNMHYYNNSDKKQKHKIVGKIHNQLKDMNLDGFLDTEYFKKSEIHKNKQLKTIAQQLEKSETLISILESGVLNNFTGENWVANEFFDFRRVQKDDDRIFFVRLAMSSKEFLNFVEDAKNNQHNVNVEFSEFIYGSNKNNYKVRRSNIMSDIGEISIKVRNQVISIRKNAIDTIVNSYTPKKD